MICFFKIFCIFAYLINQSGEPDTQNKTKRHWQQVMNLETAKNTEVFVLEYDREDALNTTIEKVNLYDFIIESVEETTSPRGVESKLHVRELQEECDCYNEENGFNKECKHCEGFGEVTKYQLCEWGSCGRGLTRGDIFDTEEEANQEWFTRTYEYDFLTDCNRDTQYFDNEEEANEYLVEYISDMLCIDKEVSVSLLKWNEKRQEIIDQRKAKEYAQYKKEIEIEEKVAEEYSKLIEPIEGETYKETASRFSKTLGEKISGRVFHMSVKKIRSKNKIS